MPERTESGRSGASKYTASSGSSAELTGRGLAVKKEYRINRENEQGAYKPHKTSASRKTREKSIARPQFVVAGLLVLFGSLFYFYPGFFCSWKFEESWLGQSLTVSDGVERSTLSSNEMARLVRDEPGTRFGGVEVDRVKYVVEHGRFARGVVDVKDREKAMALRQVMHATYGAPMFSHTWGKDRTIVDFWVRPFVYIEFFYTENKEAYGCADFASLWHRLARLKLLLTWPR